MGRFIFRMEGTGCGMCGVTDQDSSSGSTPELRYVVDKQTGRAASLQLCRHCAKKVDENAAAEAAVKKHQQELEEEKIAVAKLEALKTVKPNAKKKRA